MVSAETELPPQTLDEKLSQGSGTKGKARASLANLEKLFGGVKVLESDGKTPTKVSVQPMERVWVWVRVSKDLFEVVDS